jgi:hypothetical protein
MTASVRLASAFPAALHADVAAVLAMMPPADLPPLGRTFGVEVNSEHLAIPYRIYNPEPPGDDVIAGLSATQKTVLQCLYTRHHDGFVRQRYLQQAIESPHAWVVSFVVQLVGEYVIEIILAIREALSDLDVSDSTQQALYGRFLAENPAFLELTSQRVTSYWNCYYRSRYFSRVDDRGIHQGVDQRIRHPDR